MATSSKTISSEKEITVTLPSSVELLEKMQRRLNELMESKQVPLALVPQFENDLEQTAKDFYAEIEAVKMFFKFVEDTEKQYEVKYDEIVSELDEEFGIMKMYFHRETTSLIKQGKEDHLKIRHETERQMKKILYKVDVELQLK